jgi:cytochrome c5
MISNGIVPNISPIPIPPRSGFARLPSIAGGLAIALALLPSISIAQQEPERPTGKEIVAKVCSKCHATNKAGAPQIGDRKAWAKRTSQGLTSLTQHAITGIRNMPSHGGSANLSDGDLTSAIVYMVNQSGGNWIEPTVKGTAVADRSGKEVVTQQCIKCHGTGLNGAPKIGDRAAWIPRGAHGIDALTRSAINGHGGMPSRGGLANLTDTEIRNAVVYMFNQGVTVAK